MSQPKLGEIAESRSRTRTVEPGPLLTRAVTGFAGWAVSIFHRVEVRGGPIPSGPVMVVANHQNALIDPLVIFRVAGRPTRPLAKAPLFDQLLLGMILRGLGGLPVYRKQDDPAQMHRNEDTFRAAIDALLRGDALQIYPEGRSHSEPGIERVRTGAARIALEAEAARGGELGLQMVPIGLTWEQKHRFRGRVLAEIGEPFPARPWLTPEGAEDVEAVRSLTDEIAERLKRHTLVLKSTDDLELLTAADRIYSREKEIHGYREDDPLVDRVPRLRRFAVALEWLRTRDPRRYEALAGKVYRVDGVSRALGADVGVIPPRYPFRSVARYTIREGLALLVGLPLALLGSVVWYPTWFAAGWAVARIRPGRESIATCKLAISFFMVPLTIVAMGVLGFLVAEVPGGVVALLATPLLGLVALAWRERWKRVRKDAAIFLRVLTRPRLRSRLASVRAELTREFDDVLEEMTR